MAADHHISIQHEHHIEDHWSMRKFNTHRPTERDQSSKSDHQQASTSKPPDQHSHRPQVLAQRINISKFSSNLANVRAQSSSQKCAKSVRIALQSAGAKFSNHPVAASDWGATLKQIGYRKIKPSFDQPKKGDIYIIQRNKQHVYGHIAGFSGSAWVSDFQQKTHAVYKGDVEYEYYRLEN